MTDTFWALVGLILFLALLLYLKVPDWIGRSLDARAKHIADELDEARRLREEAQNLLAEYQQKRHDAEQEAAHIVAVAQREAESLTQIARSKTQEYIERRQKLAEQKIAQAERDAVSEVRSKAVDIAIETATQILGEEAQGEKAASLFKSSLAEVRARLN